jgi:type IV secretory pathway TraG/TraD family ATPase VirD4
VQEAGRKLLLPEEIMVLSERTAIVFAPGVKPFTTELVRYYEKGFNTSRPKFLFALAVKAIVLAIVGLALIAIVAG